ncbi:hypothetical protein [Psittacicella hinzii]|uniref:Uncharacterized protein n=1 Tax=Psittacicella hinzii TaxID=2028575 RepID=A0A3A1YFJ4_9GAMM|nr:hypothetical protein [Psittacicella hinzii]RIY36206.1 hypothetical protein CKF58_06085 [Psittacicella hinzii]
MLLQITAIPGWYKPEVILRELQEKLYVPYKGTDEDTVHYLFERFHKYLNTLKHDALADTTYFNQYPWITEQFYFAFPSLQEQFASKRLLHRHTDEIVRHITLFFSYLSQFRLYDKQLATVYKETYCVTTTRVLSLLCLISNIKRGLIEVKDGRRENAF